MSVRRSAASRGRRYLHLQCHFGLDTLSWARLGAIVTGIDFSEEAIAAARGLAGELGIPATFVRSDLYRLPEVLARTVRRRLHVERRPRLAPGHRGLGPCRGALRSPGRLPVRNRDPSGCPGIRERGRRARGAQAGVPLLVSRRAAPFRGQGFVRRPRGTHGRARRVRLGSFARRDRYLARGCRPPARVPSRVRFRQVAGGLPRRERGRSLAPARGFEGEPPALLLAQSHEARRLIVHLLWCHWRTLGPRDGSRTGRPACGS